MDLSPQAFAAAGAGTQEDLHVRGGYAEIKLGADGFGSLAIPIPDCDLPRDVVRLLGACTQVSYSGRSKALEAVTATGVMVKVPITGPVSGGFGYLTAAAAERVPVEPVVAIVQAKALQAAADLAVLGAYSSVRIHRAYRFGGPDSQGALVRVSFGDCGVLFCSGEVTTAPASSEAIEPAVVAEPAPAAPPEPAAAPPQRVQRVVVEKTVEIIPGLQAACTRHPELAEMIVQLWTQLDAEAAE